jgi:hypothetical protein
MIYMMCSNSISSEKETKTQNTFTQSDAPPYYDVASLFLSTNPLLEKLNNTFKINKWYDKYKVIGKSSDWGYIK